MADEAARKELLSLTEEIAAQLEYMRELGVSYVALPGEETEAASAARRPVASSTSTFAPVGARLKWQPPARAPQRPRSPNLPRRRLRPAARHKQASKQRWLHVRTSAHPKRARRRRTTHCLAR